MSDTKSNRTKGDVFCDLDLDLDTINLGGIHQVLVVFLYEHQLSQDLHKGLRQIPANTGYLFSKLSSKNRD